MDSAATSLSSSPHRRPWLPTSLGVTSVLVLLLAWRLSAPEPPPPAEPVQTLAAAAWPVNAEISRSLETFLSQPDPNPASQPVSPSGAATDLAADAWGTASLYRGIALGLYSQSMDYDYSSLIEEIADHGANTVSLFFNMYQENRTASEMEPLTQLADQEAILVRAAKRAHEQGLSVLAFPLVLLTHAGPREWRGNLEPDDLDAWFRNYTAHVVRLARTCEAANIEALCIGSEFSSLEEYADRWRKLIADVREVYSGTVFYSSNWDHYRKVPFWDAVDQVGLSGYYELTKSKTPALDDLVEAWSDVRGQILGWKQGAAPDKRIVFTEIGYANLDGTNIYPWDYTMEGAPDPAEQALCYEAFIRTWSGHPEFGGVYFYNWFGVDSVADTGYSPRGKPAAHLIRLWYDALASPDPPLTGH